jgi:hypothetical protein
MEKISKKQTFASPLGKILWRTSMRLPDSFKGIMDYSGPLKDAPNRNEGVVMELQKTIPIDYEKIHSYIEKFWAAEEDARKEIFNYLVEIVNDVAPENCIFKQRNGAWGYWEKHPK